MIKKINNFIKFLKVHKFPAVTTLLTVVIVALFYLGVEPIGILFTLEAFKVHQLFTYSFFHDSFGHLFANMVPSLFVGGIVERKIGSFKFLVFILLTMLISGMFGIMQYFPSEVRVIGFSGVFFAIFTLLLTLKGRGTPVFLFYIIPLNKNLLLVLTVLSQFFLLFFATVPIAIAVHIGGIFAGLMFAHILNNT